MAQQLKVLVAFVEDPGPRHACGTHVYMAAKHSSHRINLLQKCKKRNHKEETFSTGMGLGVGVDTTHTEHLSCLGHTQKQSEGSLSIVLWAFLISWEEEKEQENVKKRQSLFREEYINALSCTVFVFSFL